MNKITFLLTPLIVALSACSKLNPHGTSQGGYLGEVGVIASGETDANKISPTDIESIYRKVGQDLSSPMLQCPEKIWPDYNWKKMNALLLQETAPSLVWRGETGKIETLDEADVPPGARNGLYSFFAWKSQDAVSIYIGGSDNSYFKDPMNLLGLLIHEGFHYLGQRDWIRASHSRGTTYPIDPTPRIYRRLLKDRLLSYFLSKGADTKSLGQASFWFHKWTQEFPKEVQNTADGYEGTARYMEWLGPIVSEIGCQASDEALLAAGTVKLSDPLQTYMGGERLSLDGEAYPIGGLSSLILRLINKNPDWYLSVPKGHTPVEELLKNVTPIEDSILPELKKEYDNSATAQNRELETTFGGDLQNLLNAQFIRVVIPTSAIHASYSPKGFYLSAKVENATIIPLASDFPFNGDSWAFTAKRDANLFSIPSPCSEASYVILIPAASAVDSDNQLEIMTPTASGKIKGSWKTDDKGIKWFCGQ
jgi:hypothetical protein